MSMHIEHGGELDGYDPTGDELTAETIAAFHELLESAPTAWDPFVGVDVTEWDDYGAWDDPDSAMQESMMAHHRVLRMRHY